MNRRQKIVGAVLLAILGFIVLGRDAMGAPKTIRGPEGSQTWDLMEWDQRVEFRALYAQQLAHCFERGDFAVDLMKERDGGSTEESHLELMRSNYETSKTDGGKPVAHHVYVDFQRMVRDLHRSHRGQYQFTDPKRVWEREVWWCAFFPRYR